MGVSRWPIFDLGVMSNLNLARMVDRVQNEPAEVNQYVGLLGHLLFITVLSRLITQPFLVELS